MIKLKILKNGLKIFVFIAIVGTIYFYRENIMDFVYQKLIETNIKISEYVPNEYYSNNNYSYVQITDDFIAKDKQHLLNIYYTIVDSGNTEFTFRCGSEYKECLNDVASISHDQTTLSNINSFVHPFNSFSSIRTKYDSIGRITVTVNKTYTDTEIKILKTKMQEIIEEQVKDTTDKREIIKIIHDYIINNTKYDSDRSDKQIVKYRSDTAYGPLLEGYGLCGGYTDAMALFLSYYNIPNFKIISENHVWNAVYLDGVWYHLDLTWDDPVAKKDVLEYTFFLITNDKLTEIEKEQHVYDKDVFEEIANQK